MCIQAMGSSTRPLRRNQMYYRRRDGQCEILAEGVEINVGRVMRHTSLRA